MKNQNQNLISTFQLMKKRAGMFIHNKNINELSSFIMGFKSYNLKYKPSSKDLFFGDRPSFHNWVEMKESENETTGGWYYALEKNYGLEEKAFSIFFEYLDQYLERKAIILFEKLVTKSQIDRANPILKIQLVTYDKDLEGVFIRYFDKSNQQVMNEKYFINKSIGLEFINSI